jgi:hypothetical protein
MLTGLSYIQLMLKISESLYNSVVGRKKKRSRRSRRREYSIIYTGTSFLAIVRIGYSAPVRKLDRRHTERLRKRDKLLTGDEGKGVGEEPNHKTARKPGPL